MLYVQLLIAAIPKVPPQQTVLCIDSGRLVSGEDDDDDDDDKETIKVCNQAGMKEAREKRRAGVRLVLVCFEGEGRRRLSAAFSKQLFGISCRRLPWEKISEEKKGMEWDGRKREDGRGEKGRKQLEDTGDKSKERKKRSRAEESGLAKGGKGRTE